MAGSALAMRAILVCLREDVKPPPFVRMGPVKTTRYFELPVCALLYGYISSPGQNAT